jgi:hypothetical protein
MEMKELPRALGESLQRAREEVLARPINDLPRPTRKQIQLRLGPHLTAKETKPLPHRQTTNM